MPITRSYENLMRLEEPSNCSFTIPSEETNIVQESTQGRSKGARPKTNNRSTKHTGTDNNNREEIRQMITDSMTSFRNEMTEFLGNSVRNMMDSLILNNTSNVSNTRPREDNATNHVCRDNSSREPFVGEKVSNIIRNWRIKFSGREDQMSIDEFIYRINILTTNNLDGNFDLLSKHAHCLFEGKALDWYWRFHRNENNLEWFAITRALKEQYKADYNDFDVMEDIHRRKQRNGESFDDFYDSISIMTDKLRNPISDANLCAILVRNLRNEIRHELIHFDISSVAQLRLEVKRHEKFVKEAYGHGNRGHLKGRVAELDDQDFESVIAVSSKSEPEVCVLRGEIKCWNCDKIGHNYFDCMEIRRVFCYGCGAKDTYRPSCPKCNVRHQGNGQKDVRRH